MVLNGHGLEIGYEVALSKIVLWRVALVVLDIGIEEPHVIQLLCCPLSILIVWALAGLAVVLHIPIVRVAPFQIVEKGVVHVIIIKWVLLLLDLIIRELTLLILDPANG